MEPMVPTESKQPSPWERLALASGIVFVALLVAAAFLFPAPPGETGSPAHNPDWLAGHRTGALAQVYVRGLAAVVQLIFIGALVTVIRRTQGHLGTLALLTFGGGITHTLVMLVANTATATAAVAAGQGVDAGAIRVLGTFADTGLTLEALAEALLFGAVGLVVLRTRVAPRWVGWLGLVGVPLYLVDAAAFPGSPVEFVGFLALLFELGWFLAASLALLARSQVRRPTSQAQMAPV